MKEYLTAREVEDLAARGIRQIPVGADVILTDLAMERASALGVTLVRSVSVTAVPSTALAVEQVQPVSALVRSPSDAALALGTKPKGCLHGQAVEALASQAPSVLTRPAVDGSSNSVIDRLVEAVRRLGH